MIFRLH